MRPFFIWKNKTANRSFGLVARFNVCNNLLKKAADFSPRLPPKFDRVNSV